MKKFHTLNKIVRCKVSASHAILINRTIIQCISIFFEVTLLQLYTIGREFSAGKIVPVKCVCSDSLERINIKDKSFLLVILEEGSLTFEI